jgi:hypothetical protein
MKYLLFLAPLIIVILVGFAMQRSNRKLRDDALFALVKANRKQYQKKEDR